MNDNKLESFNEWIIKCTSSDKLNKLLRKCYELNYLWDGVEALSMSSYLQIGVGVYVIKIEKDIYFTDDEECLELYNDLTDWFFKYNYELTSLTHEEYHILRTILGKIRNEGLFDNKWNSIDVINKK